MRLKFIKFIIIFIKIFILIGNPLVWAKSAEDTRRIEQEKRSSLSKSEVKAVVKVKSETGHALSDDTDEDYFQRLLEGSVTYQKDGVKAAVMLLGYEKKYSEFKAQVSLLKINNILSQEMAEDISPDRLLSKGFLAYVLYETLDIKGGVHLHLFGTSERYALKELVYLGIMFPGNKKDVVSPQELITTITKAARFLGEN